MSKLEVLPIKRSESHSWCLEKHYARRVPSITYAFGLFVDDCLEGIVTFGTPPSSTLLNGVAGIRWTAIVLELNRLCINDAVPKNSASFLVSNAMKQLPTPRIIVSYADTGIGHVGYIYQACNFMYTGLSAKFLDPKVKGLEHQHHATYANGKSNQQLRDEYGDDLYFEERDRKHRYLYIHAPKLLKKRIARDVNYTEKPYPKGDSSRYDCCDIKSFQTILAI
jgi:hypothetical protein